MNILIIDWMNLVKRYIYTSELAELEVGEVTQKLTYSILNRIDKLFFLTKPDLVFICSDCGFNKRAAGIVEGYKQNRKKYKSLTDEEKEKSYLEYLKLLARSLPTAYIEIKDVEADMIIRCVIQYMKQLNNNINFTIASNDTDMLQLIDDNVRIYNWNKEFVNKDNWVEKTFKENIYFNSKNYALAKSIVGDKSDNVKGANGIGWKKIFSIFELLHKKYSNEYIVETIYSLIDNLKKTVENDKGLKKKFEKIITILNENVKLIHNNMFVIDMNLIETPFLFQINQEIKKSLTTFSKSKFHRRIILDLLKLNYKDDLDTDDEEILKRNSKALISFMYLHKKTVYNANILLKRLVE